MKYQVRRTSQFKKDYKRSIKRGLEIDKLNKAIELLAENGCLPAKYKDHPLVGNNKRLRECHIEPDWLLVYEINHGILVLVLTATGTHSDLF
ncbi:MAG: type II toxin-antitoxin system YafQ family toxin [Alphaproteobacteria bacterium]|nr:type II toxin-antitoxin system YafQ family toxin [Alphaproteobacteria bacterium]MCL2505005.1 type II toxin-antitoxin system YafQ family toxin [Alphaproteobacteria bacterium]